MRIIRVILLAALLLCGPARAARGELVNGIRAIVSDSIITYQQVEFYVAQAEYLVRERYSKQPDKYRSEMARIRNNGLEDLLQRELILHDFQASGFNVPESIIDEIVQDRIHERYTDRVQFNKFLAAQGLTFEAFRKDVRDQLIIEEMKRKFVPEPIISPHKIETFYQLNRDKYKIEDQVRMRIIVINQRPDDPPGTAHKRAGEILLLIKDGATFAEMATSYSDGSQRTQGGETGWQDVSVLNKPLMEPVSKLKPGEYSDVIETPGACFLVLLEERRPEHFRPLNDLRDEIERTLSSQESTRLWDRWMVRLKKKTFVRYF